MKRVGSALFGLFLCCLPLHAQDSKPTEATPLEMRSLEEEISAMKREVLRQKTELRKLEEAALFGKLTDTTAMITFKNSAEGFMRFKEGEFYLDGKLINKLTADQVTKQQQGFAEVLNGEVPPGEHVISLKLTYRGDNQAPFTYFKDYEFNVDSQKTFTADQGKSIAIEILTSDRGYFKSEVKERLVVSYNLTNGS